MLEATVIFETLYGSRAFGLAREGSDRDVRGVIVGPPGWYFGVRGGPEQVEPDAEHVYFEVRKALRLALAGNPSMLEMLFTDPADHSVVTSAGQRLIEARANFLTKRIEGTFAGYALAQLRRIRTHRRWLLSPPAKEPSRADFGLPERSLVSRDQLGALEALAERDALPDLSPGFLDVLAREKRFRAARREWEQHQQWLRERNPKRAALEARFGYDTKHAMHLVRLLRMAREALETGALQVRRPDRDELLAIRDGALSYEELEVACEKLDKDVSEAASRSALPDAPDEDAADALAIEIIERVLRESDR